MSKATKSLYLVELTGDDRYVYGPYTSLAAAKKAAGKRYFVASGTSGRLTDGGKFRRGELAASVRSGGVVIEDGTGIDGI